jgi:hypothetical protein
MSFEEFLIDKRVSPVSSDLHGDGAVECVDRPGDGSPRIQPFVVGAIGELAITVVTLGLVLAADAVFQI